MQAPTQCDLVYGVDYDYVIESFYCEFKLDKPNIRRIVAEYITAPTEDARKTLRYELHELCPEYPIEDLVHLDIDGIPDTVIRKIYFVQSPKGKDGLPTIHYSLKEKMLSDLRATRGRVKKEQAKAKDAGDHVGEVRFNAKQLAIKVVCNSEYGASNNEYFAHYDPDIASAVTFGSRQLIGFLTCNLECDYIYVDKRFISENQKQIDLLKSIDCLTVEPHVDKSNLFVDRRHTLARIFDANYNIVETEVYCLRIQKSTVVYQDTDSNYYINKYITNRFTKELTECSPDIIDGCMHCMLAHNVLLANFIRDSINRRPASLGFEGSFIVARYLNRKKKYYGIKWSEDGSTIPTARLSDGAYKDNILVSDYLPYWKPKETVLPQPNGEYLYLNTDELLHKGVNYLDYVHDYNIKCTGVDLARRDQYKFVNYFHMLIVQKDLRIMKYIGNNKWEVIGVKEPMQAIVEGMIELFRNVMASFSKIAAFQSAQTPEIEFKAIDFAKTAAYRPGKMNAVSKIVKRLMTEHKEKYIPSIGERMSYIVLIDDITRNERLDGKAADGNVSTKSYVIDEAIEDIKRDMSEAEYTKHARNAKLVDSKGKPMIKYEDWINAKIISALDCKYYLECLCKSTALYMIGDIYPEEMNRIDMGLISPAEANKLVTKLQGMIAKEYVKRYFHYGVSLMGGYRNVQKQLSKMRAKYSDGIEVIFSAYKSITSVEQITPSIRDKIIADCDTNIDNIQATINDIDLVYKTILTNSFSMFNASTPLQKKLYDKYRDQPDGLLKQMVIYGDRLNVYENLKRVANGITFDK